MSHLTLFQDGIVLHVLSAFFQSSSDDKVKWLDHYHMKPVPSLWIFCFQ